MIKQAVYNLSLTPAELKQLEAIKPWKGTHWDAPPSNIVKIITKIRQQLEEVQTVCSYCGLKLYGTSNPQIEHIAPKSKHPNFTFTLKNLTLACDSCNCSKKGQKEVVNKRANTYEDCEFLLVHPYFDDPDLHFEWTDNHIQILIQAKDGSPKGLFSIEMFELCSPKMSMHRAQQVRYDEMIASMPLTKEDQKSTMDVMKYKESI